jgi:hypothetical protein
MPTQRNLIGTGCAPAQAQASVGIPATGLTAVGSTQGTALVLPSDANVISTAAASTGAILPACGATGNAYGLFDTIIVVNHGANAILLYPPVGGQIANGTVNAGLSVPANKTATVYVVGANLYAASVSS